MPADLLNFVITIRLAGIRYYDVLSEIFTPFPNFTRILNMPVDLLNFVVTIRLAGIYTLESTFT